MCADIVASNCSAGYIFPNICTESCMLSSFFDNFDYRLSTKTRITHKLIWHREYLQNWARSPLEDYC